MSNIALTSGMKSALLSLQSTQKLYDQTQERLTSGEKVSNPADDPAAYYAASTLYDQADALEGRLDNMEQAVEAISAADNGIESMISALSSMTAIVESALATDASGTDTRAALGKKFNDLLIQLSTLADDSAYGGQNLLADQDITVQMGASYDDSTFTIEGFYVAGLTQVDTDADGEVSSIVSGNIPTEWGEGADAASNYAFALNMVEDPTSIVGIQSYGVPDPTAEATVVDSYLETISNNVAGALAIDPNSSTADTDLKSLINKAVTAANSITGTNGAFELDTDATSKTYNMYVYSGEADDGTDAVLSSLNSMLDLYNTIVDAKKVETAMDTTGSVLTDNALNSSDFQTAIAAAQGAASDTEVDDAMTAALTAANKALGDEGYTGSFSYNASSSSYEYSDSDGSVDTTEIADVLTKLYALSQGTYNDTTLQSNLATSVDTLTATNSLATTEVKVAVAAANSIDITEDTAAADIGTQISAVLTNANTAINDANEASAGAYDGKFVYNETSEIYEYTGTATQDTDEVVTTLNAMADLQASAASLATDTETLTSQGTALGNISPSDFGVTETTSDEWELDWTDVNTYATSLKTVLSQIEEVQAVLETRSKLLSFDESTITMRQDYTEEFINTLQEGADSLTLADLNEESANLLSLETSQSLAVQAMSLANDQMQNVLRLLQ